MERLGGFRLCRRELLPFLFTDAMSEEKEKNKNIEYGKTEVSQLCTRFIVVLL